MEHEGDRDSNSRWCTWNVPPTTTTTTTSKGLIKKTGGIGNQKKKRKYPDPIIVKFGKNT